MPERLGQLQRRQRRLVDHGIGIGIVQVDRLAAAGGLVVDPVQHVGLVEGLRPHLRRRHAGRLGLVDQLLRMAADQFLVLGEGDVARHDAGAQGHADAGVYPSPGPGEPLVGQLDSLVIGHGRFFSAAKAGSAST